MSEIDGVSAWRDKFSSLPQRHGISRVYQTIPNLLSSKELSRRVCIYLGRYSQQSEKV